MEVVQSLRRLKAVLFDFSGTLFRLEEKDSWFEGIKLPGQAGRQIDGHVQAELMRRMTAPTGHMVPMSPNEHYAWTNRDLEPDLHREAYLHVLRESGVTDHHAESLYQRLISPASWTPYLDTADVLRKLSKAGIRTAVVSNIAFDIRPAFERIEATDHVDEFVLSYEVGAVKPDPKIFATALQRLEVEPAEAIMVGDSEEADGGAQALGCEFVLVDPLPVADRPDGLRRALLHHGVDVS